MTASRVGTVDADRPRVVATDADGELFVIDADFVVGVGAAPARLRPHQPTQSRGVQRMYFRCAPEADAQAPSEPEIWDRLQARVLGTSLAEGPIF